MSIHLSSKELQVAYDDHIVVKGIDLDIPEGELTALVGPNGCGKSTFLRALARLLAPLKGSVVLDGKDVRQLSTKLVAKKIGLLPQTYTIPNGITVHDLVERGRFPHHSFLSRWSEEDDRAVKEALVITNMEKLKNRCVEELSGGQRQRAWLATVLAQKTPLLLLDEPTTYLDLSHQLDILDVLADLPSRGRTVLAVLHDVNLAARYATYMIAMRDGKIVAQGRPKDILTVQLVDSVFGVKCKIIVDAETGIPIIVPLDRRTSKAQRASR